MHIYIIVVAQPWPATKQPHSCSLTPTPTFMTTGKAKAKARKLMTQDKDSLVSEGRSGGGRKSHKHNYSPSLVANWCSDQSLSNSYPGIHSPLQFLLPNRTLYGMEHSFGQFVLAVSAVSPLKFLPTPSLLVEGTGCSEWEKEKALLLSSAVQQQPKSWCVTTTGLVTNIKLCRKAIPLQPDSI